MRPSSAIVLLAAMSGLAFQAQANVELTNIECVGATSFEEMEDCATLQLSKWDKALNITYKRAVAMLERRESNFLAQPIDTDPGSRAHAKRVHNELDALKQAQRIWIEYRDANCSFYSFNYNGVPDINIPRCKTKMTEKRTMELLFGVLGDNPNDDDLKEALKEVEPVVGRRLRGPGPQMIN